jgi:glycerol-3-phosphate dehydrogenase (NAD(P)+)
VRGDPTAAVVASSDPGVAERVQRGLSSSTFRLYQSDDVVGVELAGGVKNVVAIAAGIVAGLGLGANTVAALMTRGLARSRGSSWLRGGSGRSPGWRGRRLMLTRTGRSRATGRWGADRPREPRAAMAAMAEVAEGTRAASPWLPGRPIRRRKPINCGPAHPARGLDPARRSRADDADLRAGERRL